MPPPATPYRHSKSNSRSKQFLRPTSGGSHALNRKEKKRVHQGLTKPELFLRLLWLGVVGYGEYWVFRDSVKADGCEWPTFLKGKETVRGNEESATLPPFHLMIVANPQILDRRSYPGRLRLFSWFNEKLADNFARKSWKMAVGRVKPDAVVFLGNLLESGVDATDRRDHSEYIHRFYANFPPPSSNTPIYYVPGHRDLGLHHSHLAPSYARERFREAFGPLNWAIEMGNHTLVAVDSVGLIEEKKAIGDEWYDENWRPLDGGALAFVDIVARKRVSSPMLLFSQTPLARPKGTSCRHSPSSLRTNQGKERDLYYDELDEDLSAHLLSGLVPSAVFSADDYDECKITHQLRSNGGTIVDIPENSVKPFSMITSTNRPGYMLVSLSQAHALSTKYLQPSIATRTTPTPSKLTHLESLCSLPNQTSIHIHVYLPLFFITLFFFLVPRLVSYFSSFSRARTIQSARANGLPLHTHKRSISRTLFRKSKDEEDEDYTDPDPLSFAPYDFGSGGGGASGGSSLTNYSYGVATSEDMMMNGPSGHAHTPSFSSTPSPFPIGPSSLSSPNFHRPSGSGGDGSGHARRISRMSLWDSEKEDFSSSPSSFWLLNSFWVPHPVRSFFRKNRFGRSVSKGVGKVTGDKTVEQIWRVTWPGILLYSFFWFYFASF